VSLHSRANENYYTNDDSKHSLRHRHHNHSTTYCKNGRNSRLYASEQNLTTTSAASASATSGMDYNEVARSSSRTSQFQIVTIGDLFRLILKNRPKIRIQFKLNEFTLVLHVSMKKSVTLVNNQFSPTLKSDVQNLLEMSTNGGNHFSSAASSCSSSPSCYYSNCSSPLTYSPCSSRSISRSTSLDSIMNTRSNCSLSSSLESMNSCYSSDRSSSSLESLSELSPTSSASSFYNPNHNNISVKKTSSSRQLALVNNHHPAVLPATTPSYTTISVSIDIEIYLNSKGITTSNQQVKKCITS